MAIPQPQKEILTRLYNVGIELLIVGKEFQTPAPHLPLLASQQPIYIGGYLENPNNSLYVFFDTCALSATNQPLLSIIVPARADAELSFSFVQKGQKQGFTLSGMMRTGTTHLDTRWNIYVEFPTNQSHVYHLYERWNPELLSSALNNDQLTPDPIKLSDFHREYKK